MSHEMRLLMQGELNDPINEPVFVPYCICGWLGGAWMKHEYVTIDFQAHVSRQENA